MCPTVCSNSLGMACHCVAIFVGNTSAGWVWFEVGVCHRFNCFPGLWGYVEVVVKGLMCPTVCSNSLGMACHCVAASVGITPAGYVWFQVGVCHRVKCIPGLLGYVEVVVKGRMCPTVCKNSLVMAGHCVAASVVKTPAG